MLGYRYVHNIMVLYILHVGAIRIITIVWYSQDNGRKQAYILSIIGLVSKHTRVDGCCMCKELIRTNFLYYRHPNLFQ